MLSYIIRRLLILPIILLGVSFLIFCLFSLLSPMERLATYVNNPSVLKNPQAAQNLIAKYHLDDPFPAGYFHWLGSIVRFDFGWSPTANQPVWDAIMQRLPATMELVLYSIIPVIIVGIWLGVISAVHHNDLIDQFIRVTAIIGWSLPTFIFGLLVLFIFYGILGWLPPGRLSTWAQYIVYTGDSFNTYTHFITIDALLNGRLDIFWDALKHLIGPIITLSYISWAYLLRITRSSMLDTLRKDYIRTARAKGVDENTVIYLHARKNAMIPVITVAGMMIIGMLGGVVITETVFTYPGLGYWAASSAQQLDYGSVIGFALLFAFIMVIGNLVVDVSYALIDPRVRLE
ncbi:MAG: ABC transporter permease [Atribacterota bacterium]|nr:ABC transporter permease [Atribacterota bacterium]MDD3030762.1 ABC transporter permease [Atribacterota bacterium]MDD3640421.1 ABC transporter permease [Atribacterota bacterium]MDD4288213.1 ABC transporter permease [Atribacterota bacterium]MDI9596743.1 ABC transporter permease [Atribacterota bacterium]